MFGTRENLDFLETSNIWLADGNKFKTVPALFTQLYTIHCLYLEALIHLLMVTYFHAFTPCFPIRKAVHTLKCGKLLGKLDVISTLNQTISFWILNKQLLVTFQSAWPLTQVKLNVLYFLVPPVSGCI